MAKSRGTLVLVVLFVGALFFLAGLIFTLQGYGIVGPNSSFMFKNPAWIYDGIFILVAGLVLVGIGVAFRPRPASDSATV
ncbi:MAG: hypothetical protein JRN15_03170 [Nitrososphaerota archaeon]|nr:hypothetical protein [Nitrososphaerota archaeon]